MFAAVLALPLLMALLIFGARMSARLLPDEGQVAFGYATENAHDIYLLDVRSGMLHNLTPRIDESLRGAAWSSNGDRLAMMIAEGPPTRGSAIVLDLYSGVVSRQAHRVPIRDYYQFAPEWTAEGVLLLIPQDLFFWGQDIATHSSKLVIERSPGLDETGQQRPRVFQHGDGDDQIQRTIAHYGPTWGPLLPTVASLYSPDWTADERYLVVSAGSGGTSDLYVIDTLCGPDCARPLWRLPDTFTDDLAPDFSPDGARVVYICRDRRGTYNLCLINRDGSGLRQITRFRGFGFIDAPAWRPR